MTNETRLVTDFIPTELHSSIRYRTYTGVLDTYIAAALADMPALGGQLHFPEGLYRVSGSIPLTKSGVYSGEGDGTEIQTTSATANIFDVQVQFIEVSGFSFSSSVTRTDGWFVDVGVNAHRFALRRFHMQGAIGGVRIQGSSTCTIESGMIFDCVAGTGVGIRIDGGMDLSIRDVVMDAGDEIYAGVYITRSGDITIEDCNLINSGQALLAEIGRDPNDTSDPKEPFHLDSLWCNNCFFDNSQRGVYLHAAGGRIERAIFDQCWFSSSEYQGVLMATSDGGVINGVDIVTPHVFLNGAHGIYLADSGVSNVFINGGAIAQSGQAAFATGAGVNGWAIRNARIGDSHGFNGNPVGVEIGTGNDNYEVSANDLRGNTVKVTGHVRSPSKVVRDNIGYVTANWGTAHGTPDAIGDLSFAHGLDVTPSNLTATAFSGTPITVVVSSIGAANAVVRLFDSAGAAITAPNQYVYWEAKA